MDLEEKTLFIAIGLAALNLIELADPMGSMVAALIVMLILTQDPKPLSEEDSDNGDDFDSF